MNKLLGVFEAFSLSYEKMLKVSRAVVMYDFNPSTQDVETARSL